MTLTTSSTTTRWRVGGPGGARAVGTAGDRPVTLGFERAGVAPLAVSAARELAVVLDGARWRADIEGWRWLATAERDGEARGYHEPGFDDAAWRATSHLHPLYHVRYEGGSWFRATVDVPGEHRDAPLVLGLGGMDDEDWRAYRVWVNGVQVDAWEPAGAWRAPHLTVLAPGDPGHAALRFDGTDLVAVEAWGLDRRRPDMVPGEREHYFFQGWLVDQFVAAGTPLEVVDDFAVEDAPADGDVEELALTLRSAARPELRATLEYAGAPADGVVAKRVMLHNDGDAPLRVLDLVVDDLQLDAEASHGGRGDPVFAGRTFAGVEHPAGVNQGDGGRVRLVEMPGVTLAPGESLAAKPSVVGLAGDGEDPRALFRSYLAGLRPRRREHLSIYSALGWYDFTNPADPLFELDAALVEENLADLRELGAPFQAYMLDDWWEPTDPERFRLRTFPEGSGPVRAAVSRELGARPGLWMSPTATHWGWGEVPGMERSLVGGVAGEVSTQGGGAGGMPGIVDEETGKWDWDTVFGLGQTCGPRLCPASEPLRSALDAAIRRHVEDLGAACLKIDGAIPHCTSTRHDHRPGRHSVEPICDALIEAAQTARSVRPDLFVIWYWGLRSPWWLAHGDALFDKGIKLEAATPSSAPAFNLRQAITLNVDQAVRHERRVPLSLMDSLGVWVGDVSWANRIGAEWWREAYVLDMARGGTILQLWGDVKLLGPGDGAFLRALHDWADAQGDAFLSATEIGGDPWRAEPYGYRWEVAGGAMVTLYNPAFESRTVGLGEAPGQALELFPCPGRVELAGDAVELAPFEVRCLLLSDRRHDAPLARRTEVAPAQRLDIGATVERDGGAWTVRGTCRLPEVRRGQHVVVLGRFTRDGEAYYHPEPHEAVTLSALMRGFATVFDTIPTARSANGPGYPWIAFRIPAGPTWSGQDLRCTLRAGLLDDVELEVSAVLMDAWWRREPGTFAPRELWER